MTLEKLKDKIEDIRYYFDDILEKEMKNLESVDNLVAFKWTWTQNFLFNKCQRLEKETGKKNTRERKN